MFKINLVCFFLLPLLASSRPKAATPNIEEFLNGHRLFTAELYQEVLKSKDSNFVFSPFSTETVLALVQSGAQDETALEIQQSLHLPLDEDEIENDFISLTKSLKNPQNYTINSANKIYVREGLVIKKDFQAIAESVYQAGLENVNFLAADAADRINEWVAKTTNNKIQDLIDPSSLSENTVAILINAIHFVGSWTTLFYTSQRPFYNSPEEVIQTDTIYTEAFRGKFHHSEALKAQFLEVPFLGVGASIVFILPDAKNGLEELEPQMEAILTTGFTEDLLGVNISIPKFSIEFQSNFVKILKDLGMKVPFEPFQADFSGAFGEKGEVYISDVVQKAFINFDEKGVEADVATGVGSVIASVPHPDVQFIADHPFLFYIKVDDVILFVGRVLNLS